MKQYVCKSDTKNPVKSIGTSLCLSPLKCRYIFSYIFYILGITWIVFTIFVQLGGDPLGYLGLTVKWSKCQDKLVRPTLQRQYFSENKSSQVINNSIVDFIIGTPVSSTSLKSSNMMDNRRNSKIILLYTPWYGTKDWFQPYMDKCQDGLGDLGPNFPCPQQCLYTHNKSYINQADVVFISLVDLAKYPIDGRDLEFRFRTPQQLWIAFVCESPANFHVRKVLPPALDSAFNWSASYRRDSEIYWPSGHFYKRKLQGNYSTTLNKTTDTLKKRKLVGWLVSNCVTQGERAEIVKEMEKYIQIDVYGRCGALKCPNNTDCRTYLGNNYKFYLAFENSLCYDYVTEKFFDIFEHQMVPIVYGLADYKKSGPSKSYINILDFENIKQLTDYLLYLDSNEAEYLKYFEWKKDYAVSNYPTDSGLCSICVNLWKAHRNNIKTYHPSFTKWWTELPLKEKEEWGNKNKTRSKNNFVQYTGRVCSRPGKFQ